MKCQETENVTKESRPPIKC